MKSKQVILIAIVGLWISSVPVLAQVKKNAAPGPFETSIVIGAQVGVTRDAIEQTLRALERNNSQGQFKADDYALWAPQFKKQVAEQMEVFQAALTQTILKKVGFWMERYNQIYLSNQFGDDQKRVLLAQIRTQIDGQLILIGEEYRNEIQKMYDLVQGFPYSLKFVRYNKPKKDPFAREAYESLNCKSIFGRGAKGLIRLIYLDAYGREFFAGNYCSIEGYTWWMLGDVNHPNENYLAHESHAYDPFNLWQETYYEKKGDPNKYRRSFLEWTRLHYQNAFFPRLAADCKSQVCLGLKAGDLSFLVGLIKSNLDKEIELPLADGSKLKIPALNMNIKQVTWWLSRVDYPEKVLQGWPFDTP